MTFGRVIHLPVRCRLTLRAALAAWWRGGLNFTITLQLPSDVDVESIQGTSVHGPTLH